jgi:hypothetical protein
VDPLEAELRRKVRRKINDLLDDWFDLEPFAPDLMTDDLIYTQVQVALVWIGEMVMEEEAREHTKQEPQP